MAMLTHDSNPPIRSSAHPALARTRATTAALAGIKRVLLYASTILLAGGGLAAIIALKTAIYFSRYHLGTG